MGFTRHAVAKETAPREDLIIATSSMRIALAFQNSPPAPEVRERSGPTALHVSP